MSILRGVLHGGGSSYSLQVLECMESSFWEDMDSSVFAEIIRFDELHTQRIAVSKKLVGGLDKYLWARKPTEGLPPQLLWLRQFEKSIVVNNDNVDEKSDQILNSLPLDLHQAPL